MTAFNCLIFFGLIVHLVTSDVSLTIGSNKQNTRSDQTVRSNYQAPQGYEYSGSYSTVAPESSGNKGQYVASYSTSAPENKAQYVYSTPAPDSKAQYVASYSTAAPEIKYVGSYTSGDSSNKQRVADYGRANYENAQYVGSYSTAAPDSKAQYVAGYSTPAPENNARYVASYSTAAPDSKAQYVAGYSTPAPENNARYVASYSTAAPDSKAQYVAGYSTPAPENNARYVGYSGASNDKAQYVASYSTAAPDSKAQYVAGYSTPAPENNARYVGSYSTVAPENRAQYTSSSSSSSRSSYESAPSGQVSSNRNYYSANQEYNPQYQNDRGVTLISKELQVPFVVSKKNDDGDGCDDTNDRKVNVQIQSDRTINENVQPNENGNQNVETAVETNAPTQPVYKTSKYEVRRPGVRKEFYDIEEKVFIKPAGTAIFELQHDKPHSSAIVNKHIYQQQSYPYPQYPQYADDSAQYYPQIQQYANHGYNPGYNPVVVQSVPSPGYDFAPPRPHVTYPTTYNPVYPSTTITPGYVPPVTSGYLPPCDEAPTKPHPPSSQHELNEEYDRDDDENDQNYDSDAAFITPIHEESADIKYASSKSNSGRDREYYRAPTPNAYNPEQRIDRVRAEYQNQRGDLAQLKANQYPQQFHYEYVPKVEQKGVQIRPNGVPSAKYSEQRASSQVEIENSKKLLDLYSANGDVTEIGGYGGEARSQQYKAQNKNVEHRVVSVTPAPEYANYVDEQSKSRRVVLSKPLYTVQQVEVREHNHRLVEDVEHDGIQPSVSEFEKLRLIGSSSYGKSSSPRKADINQDVEYVTPVPQEYAQLRAGSPVPETLEK